MVLLVNDIQGSESGQTGCLVTYWENKLLCLLILVVVSEALAFKW